MPPGPTLKRRQLGIELRRLREAAGLTQADVALRQECSTNKIKYMEGGQRKVDKSLFEAALRLYGAYDSHYGRLEDMRTAGSTSGWWTSYKLPERLATYVGLESDAISAKTFDLALLPGLFQTEEYAREVHRLGGDYSSEDVDRLVTARMQRQTRLSGPDPLHVSAVVSEWALQCLQRRTDIATGQFDRLIELAQWTNIEMQVLPQHLHGAAGSFVVLTFPEHLLVDIGFEDRVVGGLLIDDSDTVDWLDRIHSRLRGQALGCDESLDVIKKLSGQLESTPREGNHG